MKKTIAAFLVAVIAVTTVTGCGGAAKSADVKSADAQYLKDLDLSKYVTLGEYKGVTVEEASPNVTDEEIESYLQYVESSMAATVEVTDRAVQEGDTVNIDYAGKHADTLEAFDGGTAQGYDLTIGSHTFIDGFEDGLIGAEIGETRDLNLTFPEGYGAEELAGKDVIFTVTVNSIKVKPDFDDEYVKTLGLEGVETIEGLKGYIKARLLEDKTTSYNNNIQSKALDAATDVCEFAEIPEKLLERFSKMYTDQMGLVANYYSSTYGQTMTTDSVIQMLMSQEGYTGELEDYKSEKSLELAKQYIMLGAIADKENITVTDDELEEKLTTDMANANSTAAEGETVDSIDEYKKKVDVEDVKESLLTTKVVKFLGENANVTEPAETTEDDAE